MEDAGGEVQHLHRGIVFTHITLHISVISSVKIFIDQINIGRPSTTDKLVVQLGHKVSPAGRHDL